MKPISSAADVGLAIVLDQITGVLASLARPPTISGVVMAGQISKGSEVLGSRVRLRIELAHLARRSRVTMRPLAADSPTHRRIIAQAVGVACVFTSSKAAEDRLPQQTDQRMAAARPEARRFDWSQGSVSPKTSSYQHMTAIGPSIATR
jgi:hypothetical protein